MIAVKWHVDIVDMDITDGYLSLQLMVCQVINVEPDLILYTNGTIEGGLRAIHAKVYGTLIGGKAQVGEVRANCITTEGVTMCTPTWFTISYNVTNFREVTPLTI